VRYINLAIGKGAAVRCWSEYPVFNAVYQTAGNLHHQQQNFRQTLSIEPA
jgi:hypothetical protein